LRWAGISSTAAANLFIGEVYLPAHNALFAVAATQPSTAFTPIPGVDLDEIRCVEEERSSPRGIVRFNLSDWCIWHGRS